uniref:Uncharacterized protein n=1 Tax=Arundo donax TaxID=35708 RepID=A0A0A9FKM1_ARUDO
MFCCNVSKVNCLCIFVFMLCILRSGVYAV